jgi:hypothetical protein
MRARSTSVLFLIMLAACDDSRVAPEEDGGHEHDAGSSTVVPPGGVGLEVRTADWFEGRVMVIEVALTNGTGGAPASLDPALFMVETDGGAIVTSQRLVGETTCSGALSVAAGATLTCQFEAEMPEGHLPLRARYSAIDGRTATAEIDACAPSSPEGLCDVGLVCDDGMCLTPCSPATPTGACAGDYACIEGACEPPCSSTEPSGYCEEGLCRSGVCNTRCVDADVDQPGCGTCLLGTGDANCAGLQPIDASCADPDGCSDCVFDNSYCRCLDDPACAGCEDQIQAAVDCYVRACPVCYP